MNDNCAGVSYVIREGDTLYKISRRFRIPLPMLLRANMDVNVYNLIPGQKICIPLFGIDDDSDDMGYVPPMMPPMDRPMPPMDRPMPPGMMPPMDRPMPPSNNTAWPPMGETRPREDYQENMMFTNEINSTRKHIVGENESLEAIMDMYNVTIEELFKCNNRNGILLREDQIINMP